jgi:RNA polymerase sigma-70 factor (ECF subfamily)
MEDNELDSLIDGAVAGSYADRAELLTFAATWRAADPERLDHLLDYVATQAGAGNDPALELLLELVHRLQLAKPAIGSRIADSALADDVAQQTLITLERNIRSYGGLAHFRTWLYAVARNEARMALRRRQPLPTGEAPTAQQPDYEGVRFTSVVANRMTIADVIDALPSPYGETLRLQLFEDLDYEAIAARLGVPIGTVRSRLAKGKELLRQGLLDAPI